VLPTQGGYALLTLSQHFATLIVGSGVSDAAIYGKIAIGIASSGALVLWAIGLWFAAIATLGLLRASYQNRIPFGVNFWGMIFPK
jgi:tellurite resistance protein TehA-like permease